MNVAFTITRMIIAKISSLQLNCNGLEFLLRFLFLMPETPLAIGTPSCTGMANPNVLKNNIMKNEGSHKVSVIHKAIYAESVRLYFTLLFCAPNRPATATLYDSAIPAMVSRHGSGSRKLKTINGVKTDDFIELKDM
jgi:hypothetical protein